MLKRIGIYLKEMYPLTSALAGPILTFIFFIGLCQMLQLTFTVGTEIVIAAVSLMLFILLIRVMDEFKDYEDDLVNFPHRPLPSGRVKKEDLKVLMVIIYGLTLILNMAIPWMLAGTLIIYLYSALMFKWFFIEKMMRKSLPLAFVTHHPVILLYFLYLVFAFHESFHLKQLPLMESLVLVPLGLCFTNWEFSRKIRPPAKEDAYTTYSKIWGPRLTTALCLGLLIMVIVANLYYFQRIGTSLNFMIVYTVFFFYLVTPYLQFLLDPHQDMALKKSAERISLLCFLSIILDFILKKTYTSVVALVLIHWMNTWTV